MENNTEAKPLPDVDVSEIRGQSTKRDNLRTHPVGDCGLGCVKLPCLKDFASVRTFITLYFAFAFLNGYQNSYTVAVLTTLERRFNLPSSLSGMLVTTSTVGFAATTLFVSHFGRRGDITKIFSGCILVSAVCALLYVIPHWLYGIGNDGIDLGHALATPNRSGVGEDLENLIDAEYELPTQYCSHQQDIPVSLNLTMDNRISKKHVNEGDGSYFFLVAFGLFVTSEVLQGLAGTPIWSLGIEFLDNATGPKLASKLIGRNIYIIPFERFQYSLGFPGYTIIIITICSFHFGISRNYVFR